MVIDEETRNEINKKAELFVEKGEYVKRRINEEIESIIKKLKSVENELIREVEIEFGKNIYAEVLNSIDSNSCLTDDKIKSVLSKEIPNDFGPDVSFFNSLREKIDSLRLWKEKKDVLNPFDLVPKNLEKISASHDSISVRWDKVNYGCYYEIELKSLSSVKEKYVTLKPEYVFSELKSGTDYHIRVRTVILEKNIKSIWSKPFVIQTENRFSDCVWKKCPINVEFVRRYSVYENNPRVAIKNGSDNECCTIIGDITIPPNKITSWKIKVLKTKDNNGFWINVGVAPFDINQNESFNQIKCGWYIDCGNSLLCSGCPRGCACRNNYTERGVVGSYVHNGDIVDVIMDTVKGELSYVVSGVNLGVAYKEVPLDKPLVPCVILRYEGESVELII